MMIPITMYIAIEEPRDLRDKAMYEKNNIVTPHYKLRFSFLQIKIIGEKWLDTADYTSQSRFNKRSQIV